MDNHHFGYTIDLKIIGANKTFDSKTKIGG
jgi:hypothetical protein